MKNKIEYYYKLINISLYEKNHKYMFYYNGNRYMYFICNRNINELNEIYMLLSGNNKYHKIVLNINKEVLTFIDNKPYILVQLHNYHDKELINIKDFCFFQKIDVNKYSFLNRGDWYNLWCKKIDYIIYQRKHINQKYLILDQYLDYYIGLSENAISYFKDTITKLKPSNNDQYVLTHRRISSMYKLDFYNVDNLIIDHPSRNISEYFKYIFFYDEVDYSLVSLIIKNLNFSSYGYRLLFCRMLFPSYFFDIYESIVNDKIDEKKIDRLVLKVNDYERFLSFIYQEINKKTKIPSIDWIS